MKSLHQAWKLGLIFFRLGCTSFGGPIAHLGYFHHECVQKRGWFTAGRVSRGVDGMGSGGL